MPTQLTKNFTLEEFTRSDAAVRMGNKNQPTQQHLANIKVVAGHLQEIRDAFQKGIKIMSGYRNPVVNKAVGGVPNSDHAQGWAVDIDVLDMSALELAHKLVDLLPLLKIDFDQIILESSRNIVHISFAPRLRGQVLTQAGGPGTPCTKGLPPLT